LPPGAHGTIGIDDELGVGTASRERRPPAAGAADERTHVGVTVIAPIGAVVVRNGTILLLTSTICVLTGAILVLTSTILVLTSTINEKRKRRGLVHREQAPGRRHRRMRRLGHAAS
jgi:hypothetical protein